MKKTDFTSLRIDIADDSKHARNGIEDILEDHWKVLNFWSSCEAFLQELDAAEEGVVVLDMVFEGVPTPMQGVDLLKRLVNARCPRVIIIITGAFRDTKTVAVELFHAAMQSRGHCTEFLHAPYTEEELLSAVSRAAAYAEIFSRRKKREQQLVQALLDLATPVELFVCEGVLKELTSYSIAVHRLKYKNDKKQDEELRRERAMKVIGLQRTSVNQKLAEHCGGARIADCDSLLDDKCADLLAVLRGELEARRGLMLPQHLKALDEALADPAKSTDSVDLSFALSRLRAPSLKHYTKWTEKLAALEKLNGAWAL